MPTIIFEDILTKGITPKPGATAQLYEQVATAVKLGQDYVEVLLGAGVKTWLRSDGTTSSLKCLHVTVDWTKRPYSVKKLMVSAIHEFCQAHGMGSDIRFQDSSPGIYFVNGKLIGPEPQDVEPP